MRGRAASLACLSLLLVYAFWAGANVWSHPRYNWDIVDYVALMHEADGEDVATAQKNTYSDLQKVVDSGQYSRYLNYTKYNNIVATDPEALRQTLNWYRPKPLYNIALSLVHRLGLSTVDATRAVGAASTGLLILLLFAWLRGSFSPFVALAATVPGSFAFGFLAAGYFASPDALAGVCLLLAAYLLLVRRSLWGFELALFVSILARSDNVLYGVLLNLLLAFVPAGLHPRQRMIAIASLVGSLVLFEGIVRSAHFYGWPVHFYHSFIEQLAYPERAHMTLTASAYFGILQLNLQTFGVRSLMAFFAGSILLGARPWTWRLAPLAAMVFIAAIPIRYLFFPSIEDRFYVANYAVAMLVLVSLLVAQVPDELPFTEEPVTASIPV